MKLADRIIAVRAITTSPASAAYTRHRMPAETSCIRRCAIRSVAAVLLLVALSAHGSDDRSLVFHHTHTGRTLEVVYARDGRYINSALKRINEFLGDFRTGKTRRIDPALLDLIYDLRQSFGGRGAYEVISAYRSPATNEMLRRKSSGVARNSQHLLGKAIDVRLTGVDTSRLRDAAIAMQRGGVGYYANSDFVHLDTGRVRSW